MKNNSEIYWSDIEHLIDYFCAIVVKYNTTFVFHDDKGINLLNKISHLNPKIYEIKIKITQFHHSIILIEGENLQF